MTRDLFDSRVVADTTGADSLTLNRLVQDDSLAKATLPENDLFAAFSESVEGIEHLTADWLVQHGYHQSNYHHYWDMQQTIDSSRLLRITAISHYWSQNFLDKIESNIRDNLKTWDNALDVAQTFHHLGNPLIGEGFEDLWNRLEVKHLSAYHTDYYTAQLPSINRGIQESLAMLRAAAEKHEMRFNIRHPSLTPYHRLKDIISFDQFRLVHHITRLPALTYPFYKEVWENNRFTFDLALPWVLRAGLESLEGLEGHDHVYYSFHSWRRVNAYATVHPVNHTDRIFGAVHPLAQHYSRLLNSRHDFFVAENDLDATGIWDTARIYRSALNTPKEAKTPRALAPMTELTALLCQLLTAYSNGRRSGRGNIKSRWSCTPANVTHGRMLLGTLDYRLEMLGKELEL